MVDCYDLEGQRERRRTINTLLVEYTAENFDEDGRWTSRERLPDLRERLWYAFAYLERGDPRARDLANTIITSSTYEFCHFAPMAALRLLRVHESELDVAATAALVAYVEDVIDDFRESKLDFIGLNDNFPTMSTFIVTIAADVLDDPTLRSIGTKRVAQLESLLTRRGVPSEYTSPTYSPIQVFATAALANHLEDGPFRRTVLECETRLWVDILSHSHPPTARMAGPYSRAYTVDSVGHTHQDRYVLWSLLGDDLLINPLNTLFQSKDGYEGGVVHLSVPFMQVSTAWLMGTDFHCPTALVDTVLHGGYPRSVVASFECNAATDPIPSGDDGYRRADGEIYEYPARSGVISTYMTEEYALGIASDEFLSGAGCDAFHLSYRRAVPASDPGDVGTIYPKYGINAPLPGQSNYYPGLDLEWADDLLRDEGRKRGIHHENVGIVLYHPRRYGHADVDSLRLSLLLPAHFRKPEELWLDERQLEDFAGESSAVEPLFVKDGNIYVAIHPLILTNHGREAAIRVESVNDYVIASFYNYEGATRTFPQEEFVSTANGFIIEVGDQSEFRDFSAFRSEMRERSIVDELQPARGHHPLRRIEYRTPNSDLSCEYSPVQQGVKHASVNGEVVTAPKLHISNVDIESLPFM